MTGLDYLFFLLEKNDTPIIGKKYHSYLSYQGIEEENFYILKEGIVKTSKISKDGRELNLKYCISPDIIALTGDEHSNSITAPFNIRIESEEALFFKVPRLTFWKYINSDPTLQTVIRTYYREIYLENIEALQNLTMKGKEGAVCSFIYKLSKLFGIQKEEGIYIDFPVTNEEISNFCGISTASSVNRIIHNLKLLNVIEIRNKNIMILDLSYLTDLTINL